MVDDKIPISKQSDIISVLEAVDIPLQTSGGGLPDFIDRFLKKRIVVQDYLTFGKE